MNASELFNLQALENEGRGVNCVRGICSEITRGDIDGAKAITNNEWDKIRNYPTIVKWLKDCGFAPKEWI